MKTVLYNTTTARAKTFQDGYRVDGVLQPLGQMGNSIWHLQKESTAAPITAFAQEASSEWVADLEENKYVQVWTVRSWTEDEWVRRITQQGENAVAAVKKELAEHFLQEAYKEKVEEVVLLPDEDAHAMVRVFPPFVPQGHTYSTGDRFYYPLDGKLYRVISAGHVSQPDHLPGVAHSLYSPVPDPNALPPEWSGFESHAFQHMEVGTAVMDDGTVYYLVNPGQGHHQPSGPHGHHGWSEDKQGDEQ